MARKAHEVVVVGGGAVGAAAALALVRQGVDVALVERSATPPQFRPEAYDPRVYALSPGSVRFLEALGVWHRVAAARVSPYGRMQVWERDPSRSLSFDAAELGAPELGFIVEESLLRASLWVAVGGAATVYAGVPAAGFAAPEGRPRLTLASGDVLESVLVIAAEGADSPVREWAGIDAIGWSYGQRAIVSHVETGHPHEGAAYQRFLPRGPLAFLPLADGRSSIVWSTDTQEAERLLALPEDEFRAHLTEDFAGPLGEIRACTPRLAFPLRLMHAERYVQPGLALVGDSAHVVHPLAGQGLNLGLADAEALVETVVRARAERKPAGALRVLQRYERRRKAENLEMLALTDALNRLFRSTLPGVGTLRSLGLSLVGRMGPVKRELAQRAMGLR